MLGKSDYPGLAARNLLQSKLHLREQDLYDTNTKRTDSEDVVQTSSVQSVANKRLSDNMSLRDNSSRDLQRERRDDQLGLVKSIHHRE